MGGRHFNGAIIGLKETSQVARPVTGSMQYLAHLEQRSGDRALVQVLNEACFRMPPQPVSLDSAKEKGKKSSFSQIKFLASHGSTVLFLTWMIEKTS